MSGSTAPTVTLREVRDGDLPVLWAQQSDPEAQRVAAVTRKYHHDRARFDAHWVKVRANPALSPYAVLADGVLAGYAALFGPPGQRSVTYWIGRDHWGRGVATAALAELVALADSRPLHASAVADNAASIRVLEKCGFVVTGHGTCFAAARDAEVSEVHLTRRA